MVHMKSRSGVVLLVAVSALVLIAVVGAVFATMRTPTEYARDTPEGVVQDYLTQVMSGELDAAAAHLDPDGQCSLEDLEDNAENISVDRVTLLDSRTSGEAARVRVEVVQGAELLDTGWTHQRTYTLRQAEGNWVLTGDPWPIFYCQER